MSSYDTPIGETRCFPMYVRNTTSKQINIYSVETRKDNPSLLIDWLVPLPSVLLPGEEMTIATVCYTPTAPNEDVTGSYIYNTSIKNSWFEIRATSSFDTTLAKPCVVLSSPNLLIGPTLFGGSQETTVTLKSNR